MPLEALTGVPADTTAVPITEQFMNYINTFQGMSSQEIIDNIITAVVGFGGKILLAIIIFIVGKWIIKRLARFLQKIFTRKDADVSVAKFTVSLINVVLMTFLIIIVIGVVGINTTSFLAIFASAGLAIGMALSGTLQNFAGGVLILTLKPYRTGDFVEVQGCTGTVKEISLFSTLLNTVDNKTIIVPNGNILNGIINNYSKEEFRRVDMSFGVAYGSDFKLVRETLLDIISKEQLIIKDRDIFVELGALSDSSVDFTIRVWTKTSDYWTVYFNLNKEVYARFNADGIEFPFPQMDVHVSNQDK